MKKRALVIGPDDAPPWKGIDVRDATNPAKHFHRELFWWFERNARTFDRVIAPCPIKQELFEGEKTHEIVLKQATGKRLPEPQRDGLAALREAAAARRRQVAGGAA